MTTPDVTVMGAGIFGLSIAFACARRGARVRVIETRGVGAGSSGGPVGALAPHTPENWNPKKQFQLESLLLAPSFWAEVETISSLSTGYGRHGRLQPIADERALDLAHARATGAAELWRGEATWTVVRDVGSWAPGSPTGSWIKDTLTARLAPARACEALAKALTTLGSTVEIGDEHPNGPVVWATGYEGLGTLSEVFGKPIGNGVKGQALRVRFDAGNAPQLFAEGLHIVPHADGTVAVGSTSEREFDAPDQTDEQIDTLHAKAVAQCPALDGAPILERWAGVRPRAKSRAPMLGPWPGREGHFIANGGFKIGFGMAPKVAEVMADLVLDQRDAIPDGFRVADNL
ncbi:MAG: FAD-dependent oxidoreductase [Pseudomonadota bacterium]